MSDERERRLARDGDEQRAQAERCRRGAHRFRAVWMGPRGELDVDQRVQRACSCGLLGEIVARTCSLSVLEDPREWLLDHGSLELIGWQGLRVAPLPAFGPTQAGPYELRRLLLSATVEPEAVRGRWWLRLDLMDPLRNTVRQRLASGRVEAVPGMEFVVGGAPGVMLRGRLGSLDMLRDGGRLVSGGQRRGEAVLDHVTMNAGAFVSMVESLRSEGDGFVFYRLNFGVRA